MARTQSQWPLKLICAALAACFAQATVAMPNAPAVVNGSATFSQTGNALTVTNTDRAIINWNTFSIGSNESVRFIQPSASSSVMNRVLAADPSLLLGALQSNGKVFLFNPAGITVGAGARIDVAGFVASTMTLSNEDFLANRLNFVATPGAGSVKIEKGAEITTASGGQVYLIAPQVENSGLITTPQGEIILAAGQRVELVDTGTPGVKVAVTAGNEQVLNMGQLMAESGRVGMVGAVVRQQGTASASSVVREGGRIFLKATQNAELAAGSVTTANGTQGGTVQVASDDKTLVSGTVSATGSSATGGRVELLGDKVGVFSSAVVDASGETGGGTVLVGGDYQGKNPDIRNASISYFGQGATIRADARRFGNGGKVIVWADDTTRAYSDISARGGAQGGDGGFVEVSGKRFLDFRGSADLRAPRGKAGTLLMDPNDVQIVNGSTLSNGSFTGDVFSATSAGSIAQIGWDTLTTQLGLGNVVVTTSGPGTYAGNISFLASPAGLAAGSAVITHSDSFGSWSNDYSTWAYSSPNSLSFLAHNNINIGASFANAGTGGIKLVAGWDGASTSAPTVNAGTGNISITAPLGSQRVVANVGGNMNLEAGNTVRLKGSSGTGGSFSSAGIDLGSGALTIKANNVELLAGADASYTDTYSQAFIRSNGAQTIDIRNGGHLWLTGGGNSGEADYGNSAQLVAYGSGSQTINVSTTGSVEVKAGSGSGADTVGGGDCPTSGSNFCSNNFAEISVRGSGNQTIAFAGGGNLKVWGDQTGTANRGNNFAEIGLDGSGAQIISGSAAIEVKSAGVGGFFDGVKNFDNEAGIFSEGTQSISGTTLTLNASGVSGGVGGAFVVAPQQTLNFTGNVLLTGGNSNLASKYGMSAGAFIGYDGAADVALTTTTGNLTLTGGSGTGGSTGIGSLTGAANVQLQADSMNFSSSAAAAAGVGAFGGGSAATISLTATGSGGINLGNYSKFIAGNGSVAFVANNAGGASLTQGTFSIINAQTVSANGNRSISLDSLYNDITDFSGSSSLASVSFTGNSATTHVKSASGATGVTLSTTTGGNKALALGTISASNTPVSVTASGAILDDNASGVVNISAGTGNIILTSQAGTPIVGTLAISADVATAGTVTATTAGGTYRSISIRDIGANQASATTINAAGGTEGDVSYYRDGNLTLANLALYPVANWGEVAVGASGNITIPAGNYYLGCTTGTCAPAAGSAVLLAGGDIIAATGGNLTMIANDNTLIAGGKLSVGSGMINSATGKPLNVVAGSVAINGGALKADKDLTVITPGNIEIIGGGTLESTTGQLTYLANDMNVFQGSVGGALGIDGTMFGNLALGTSTGSSGYMNASNGIVDLAIGGAGIDMYNGSHISSTDATQPAGGLVKLFFPGLSGGGSTINGVASFDGGYKVGSALTTLGSGLEVTYGILTNPVSNAIVAAMNSTSSSGGGTSETSGSLTLAGASTGTSPTATVDGTQTVGGTVGTFGGTVGTFGGTEATTSENSPTTGSTQETQNAKKKPAQCSA